MFVTVFATVIAITKDLPDVEGDKAHGIQTFATRMGVPAVANLGARRSHPRACCGCVWQRWSLCGGICPAEGLRG